MADDERRRRRSGDPLVALHYQLAELRTRGALDAIVVADASGVVVAGAGSWAMCEELAAYAPLLAHGTFEPGFGGGEGRVEALRRDTAVTTFEVGEREILVCARGGDPFATLQAAAGGAERILKAA